MSFIMKKKKYKFEVDFELKELRSVTLVNGLIFVKIRLLETGGYRAISPRQEVRDHVVPWCTKYKFPCKMHANVSNGVLDSKYLRLSVRKEVRGGRSCIKLGFVEINLAELAGCGKLSKKYLLEGYDTKNGRQDNSTLNITIEMILLSGDPLFKRPSSSCFYISPYSNDTLPETRDNHESDNVSNGCKNRFDEDGKKIESKGADNDCVSGGSVSSGLGSLPCSFHQYALSNSSELLDQAKNSNTSHKSEIGPSNSAQLPNVHLDQFEIGHTRNSSNLSQQSKISGYGSLPSHSRQGSTESGNISRNPSSASGFSDSLKFNSAERKRIPKKMISGSENENRVDSTRIDSVQFINQFKENLEIINNKQSGEQEIGLQLDMLKSESDATTALEMKS